MVVGNKLTRSLFRLVIVSLFALIVSDVRADLDVKQARKAVTRMAGFELTNGAVRIRAITPTGTATAEVTASIRNVFRFGKDQQGRWRVMEIRTGPNNWEDIESIARAQGVDEWANECNAPDPPARGAAAVEPSVKRSRCLLGSLFGIEVPSDAVRIQEVAPFGMPLASQPSTTVVAWIQVEARVVNQGKSGWQVAELRTGKGNWVKLEPVVAALNDGKRKKARAELESIARALEKFRQDRGSYLIVDKHSVVIDHLSPRYLSRVIRLDPWHQPYSYQGQHDRFTLSSAGPDKKEATADDIILTGPTQ